MSVLALRSEIMALLESIDLLPIDGMAAISTETASEAGTMLRGSTASHAEEAMRRAYLAASELDRCRQELQDVRSAVLDYLSVL